MGKGGENVIGYSTADFSKDSKQRNFVRINYFSYNADYKEFFKIFELMITQLRDNDQFQECKENIFSENMKIDLIKQIKYKKEINSKMKKYNKDEVKIKKQLKKSLNQGNKTISSNNTKISATLSNVTQLSNSKRTSLSNHTVPNNITVSPSPTSVVVNNNKTSPSNKTTNTTK